MAQAPRTLSDMELLQIAGLFIGGALVVSLPLLVMLRLLQGPSDRHDV